MLGRGTLPFTHLCYYYTYSELTAFYRYSNPSWLDHFYTIYASEIGTTVSGQRGHHGYVSQGTQCLIYTRQVTGTVPLYRYMNDDKRDHFYTINPQANGIETTLRFGMTGRHGYRFEGIAGYCFSYFKAGTIPLHRYYKYGTNGNRFYDTICDETNGDHFYTTDSSAIGTTIRGQVGRHGYRYESIECYVFPKNYCG